jgi:hypothetical protein
VGPRDNAIEPAFPHLSPPLTVDDDARKKKRKRENKKQIQKIKKHD